MNDVSHATCNTKPPICFWLHCYKFKIVSIKFCIFAGTSISSQKVFAKNAIPVSTKMQLWEMWKLALRSRPGPHEKCHLHSSAITSLVQFLRRIVNSIAVLPCPETYRSCSSGLILVRVYLRQILNDINLYARQQVSFMNLRVCRYSRFLQKWFTSKN